MKPDMTPVKENRAYVKGRGACINVDDSAYRTRIKKLKAAKAKDKKIADLENKVEQLTTMVEQLLKVNTTNGN